MRTTAPVSIGVRAVQLIAWLALGSAAWLLFVGRTRRESWLLYPLVLLATAFALLLLAWLRRLGLKSRIEEFELKVPDAVAPDGKPLAFTLRVASRGPVPVRLIVATLSAVEVPQSEGELPAVVAREEAVLAERTKLDAGKPLDLAASLPIPASSPSTRLQLDAVLFIGPRPARRATVVLRNPRPGKTI